MPRFKATKALRKVNPIIDQGHKVFISYNNTKAFETRKITATYGKYGEHQYSYSKDRMPSKDFHDWMIQTAGPMGVLWITEKADEGIDVYFVVPAHAMLAKLTWGGK